jgi:hypothetical protein
MTSGGTSGNVLCRSGVFEKLKPAAHFPRYGISVKITRDAVAMSVKFEIRIGNPSGCQNILQEGLLSDWCSTPHTNSSLIGLPMVRTSLPNS